MGYTLEAPFGSDALSVLQFAVEVSHRTSGIDVEDGYPEFREETLEFYKQARLRLKYDEDVSYLAMNYMDRYLAKKKKIHVDDRKLLSVGCLAAALQKLNVPGLLSFGLLDDQGFDEQTILNKVEEVSSTLNFDMDSVTPIAFLDYFLSFTSAKACCPSIKISATMILRQEQSSIILLDFKPSVLSAAVLVWIFHDNFFDHYHEFRAAIFGCAHVVKREVEECLSFLRSKELTDDSGLSSSSGSNDSTDMEYNQRVAASRGLPG